MPAGPSPASPARRAGPCRAWLSQSHREHRGVRSRAGSRCRSAGPRFRARRWKSRDRKLNLGRAPFSSTPFCIGGAAEKVGGSQAQLSDVQERQVVSLFTRASLPISSRRAASPRFVSLTRGTTPSAAAFSARGLVLSGALVQRQEAKLGRPVRNQYQVELEPVRLWRRR